MSPVDGAHLLSLCHQGWSTARGDGRLCISPTFRSIASQRRAKDGVRSLLDAIEAGRGRKLSAHEPTPAQPLLGHADIVVWWVLSDFFWISE